MPRNKNGKNKGKTNEASVVQNTASSNPAPRADDLEFPVLPTASSSLSISALQARNLSLEEENRSLIAEFERLKFSSQEKDYEKTVQDLQQDLAEKNKMLSDQSVLLAKFKTLLEQAESDRDHISTYASDFELQLQSLQDQLAAKESITIKESQDGGPNEVEIYSITAQLHQANALVKRREETLENLQQVAAKEIETLQNIIQQKEFEIAVLTEQLTQAKAQNIDIRAENQSLLAVKDDLSSRLKENAATIDNLTQTLANSSQQIEFSVGVSAENTALQQEISRLQNLTTRIPSDSVPSYFMQRMQDNYTKAQQAISRLEEELSSNQEHTARDSAIQGIVACLKSGLSESDPEVFFTAKKEALNGYLNTLRGITSVFNTAVNAILTVLAVLSIVGIPGLLLTGTLQSNKAKHGSEFAFCMFGAKQKAERDIHAVMQSMSLGA